MDKYSLKYVKLMEQRNVTITIKLALDNIAL